MKNEIVKFVSAISFNESSDTVFEVLCSDGRTDKFEITDDITQPDLREEGDWLAQKYLIERCEADMLEEENFDWKEAMEYDLSFIIDHFNKLIESRAIVIDADTGKVTERCKKVMGIIPTSVDSSGLVYGAVTYLDEGVDLKSDDICLSNQLIKDRIYSTFDGHKLLQVMTAEEWEREHDKSCLLQAELTLAPLDFCDVRFDPETEEFLIL